MEKACLINRLKQRIQQVHGYAQHTSNKIQTIRSSINRCLQTRRYL